MSTNTRGVRGRIEALAQTLQQTVETRTRLPGFGVHYGDVDKIDPPEDLEEYAALAVDVPIVRKSLTDFASDVVEPGHRIETENERAKSYLEDDWLPQAAIIAGEKHNDFGPFVRMAPFERWRRGEIFIEHVRANPSDPGSPITGAHYIRPETLELVTYDNKRILVDPNANESGEFDGPETQRGESAAYVQWGDNALVTSERDEIPLSQNDVTRSVLHPGAGDLRGNPVTETISDDVTGFRNILRDLETAIETKAWGLWSIGFGRDTIEYMEDGTEVTEIIEWSEDDQDTWVEDHLEDIEPGAILTHDGEIDLERLPSEVPDLIDELGFFVSNITSALPTPLYVVGFEKNINQFVTEKQDDRYQQLVNDERQALEQAFTRLCKKVVETNLDMAPPEDLQFKLEPAESESPVLSMSDDEIERLESWSVAFDNLRGDLPADMFVAQETLLELALQLDPDESMPDPADVDVDESDEEVQQMAEEMRQQIDGGAAEADD